LIEYQYSNEVKDLTKIQFFWKSNEDPWDETEIATWTPYDIEDQYVLIRAYDIFSKSKKVDTYDFKE